MRTAQAFSIIALLGSALAAPAWGDWNDNDNTNVKVVEQNNDAVVTEYVTVTVKGGKPTQAAQQAQQTWAPAATTAAPQAQQTWAAAGSGDVGNDGSWQSVVAEWRSRMGLAPMTPDEQLVQNAQKTAADGNGQMVHQLLDGTMGQVLAPGSPDDFESVFVGGWLCEMPDKSGMDGICGQMSQGWSYDGQTGHAEILRDSYKNIGCACAGGIWACDVS